MSTFLRTIVAYAPPRHAPAPGNTASALPFQRQLLDGVQCQTSAGPTPTPFCGAMVPNAMCSGWSVTNVAAQPTIDLSSTQLVCVSLPSFLKSAPIGLSWARALPTHATHARSTADVT